MSKKAGILAILCLSAFAGTAQGGANVSGVVVQSFTYHVSPLDMINSVSIPCSTILSTSNFKYKR